MGLALGFMIASVAIAIVGAGVSTWQTLEARKQQADEAEAISEQKEEEAQQARDAAAFAEQQHRRRIAIVRGKNIAAEAAAGIDISSGSPLIQEIDLTEQAELEALNIRRGGAAAASGRVFESRIAKFRRDTARAAMPLDIAGGALTAARGATSAYGSYASASRPATSTVINHMYYQR